MIVQMKMKYSFSVMMWGCFCFDGFGRLKNCQRINKQQEINWNTLCLLQSLCMCRLSETDYIFQQDNSLWYSSYTTKSGFQSKGIKVIQWFPNSVHVNSITNSWEIVKIRFHIYTNSHRKTLNRWNNGRSV